MIKPTTPISEEMFGHWAVLLTLAIAALMATALLWRGGAAPARRAVPEFFIERAPRSAQAFEKAVPPILRQTQSAQ